MCEFDQFIVYTSYLQRKVGAVSLFTSHNSLALADYILSLLISVTRDVIFVLDLVSFP